MTYEIITTKNRLDELPRGAVVLTCFGDAVQLSRQINEDPAGWHWLIDDGTPLTLIWEPNQ